MPRIEPIGLKLCAMFSRRVAVSGEPILSIYGLAVVSSTLHPPAMIYMAMR